MAANVEFTNEPRPALIRAKSKCLDNCVRTRDQKPYLNNETKVGTRIKTEATFHEGRDEKGKRLVIFMCQPLLFTIVGSKTMMKMDSNDISQ